MPPPLPERYHLEVRIGRDGDVEEWLATDEQLDRPVLVRILGPESGEGRRTSFIEHTRLAASVAIASCEARSSSAARASASRRQAASAAAACARSSACARAPSCSLRSRSASVLAAPASRSRERAISASKSSISSVWGDLTTRPLVARRGT